MTQLTVTSLTTIQQHSLIRPIKKDNILQYIKKPLRLAYIFVVLIHDSLGLTDSKFKTVKARHKQIAILLVL